MVVVRTKLQVEVFLDCSRTKSSHTATRISPCKLFILHSRGLTVMLNTEIIRKLLEDANRLFLPLGASFKPFLALPVLRMTGQRVRVMCFLALPVLRMIGQRVRVMCKDYTLESTYDSLIYMSCVNRLVFYVTMKNTPSLKFVCDDRWEF